MEFRGSKPGDTLEYAVRQQCCLPYGQTAESSCVQRNRLHGKMGFVILRHAECEWQWCHLRFITHSQ